MCFQKYDKSIVRSSGRPLIHFWFIGKVCVEKIDALLSSYHILTKSQGIPIEISPQTTQASFCILAKDQVFRPFDHSSRFLHIEGQDCETCWLDGFYHPVPIE